jgi:hypothetical protein
MVRLYIVLALAALMLRCSQFPTRYDRIETNKIRNIGFVYEPFAEGAPGDTIHLHAYFGGEKVVSVSWQMSYSHVQTVYGTDTVMDVFNMPRFDQTSNLPDSMDFSFIVPESTFFLTKAIQPKSLDLIKSGLPLPMRSMSQQELAAFLLDLGNVKFTDNLSILAFAQRWGPALGITEGDSASAVYSSLLSAAAGLFSVFSVSGVLYANATSELGHKLKIKGDFSIRYNRRLQNSPFVSLIPVNHPPKIRWIALYKVEGDNVTSFDPSDPSYFGKCSVSYLYNEMFPDSVHDTVLIDKGYTYFLAADSGIVTYTLKAGTKVIDSLNGGDTAWKVLSRDSTISDTSLDRYHVKNAKGNDTVVSETFYYDWQYEDRDLDSVSQPLDSLMVLSSGGIDPVVRMLPSLDTKFTHAHIWTTVYDFFLGEYNRPAAFAIRNLDVYFKYSEAYIKAKNK